MQQVAWREKCGKLWRNVHLATMDPSSPEPYGAILNGAVAVENNKIIWCGPEAEVGQLPAEVDIIDGQQCWLTPGLVDCHTHLVFAGNRSGEFEQRLQGVSYQDIAQAGGGIQATVTATRKATEDELYELALSRLRTLENYGVTSVEIKSGYGLDRESELKILTVINRLRAHGSSHIFRTFLGPHALPAEFSNQDDFISYNCQQLLQEFSRRNLIDGVDIFCESIGFSAQQTRKFFAASQDLGLPLKVHAEQLSNQGGSRLAAEFKALSADHLEYANEDDVRALAEAGTVAVLLPAAFYYLNESQRPPIQLLRKYAVPMALGSDFNPGSAPIISPRLIMNMACVLFNLTPREALAGMTRVGAQALAMGQQVGQLSAGFDADFCLWRIQQPAELVSQLGQEPLYQRVFQGRISSPFQGQPSNVSSC